MSSKPMNLLFILSDEHNKDMMGCAGHPVVQTPNLDRLAANGVRFNNAYCNNPICVPSRASLATGRYVHQIGNWDNSAPYVGEFPSWGHRVEEQGYKTTTIGKLHYRDDSDDTGFPDKRISLNVMDGIGDIFSLVRDNLEPRTSSRDKITEAGPGSSSYSRYDLAIAEEAVQFLQNEAHIQEKPWVLFVSFVTPHFPLIAPQEFYDLYPLESVIFPKQYSLAVRPMHPVIEAYRQCSAVQDEFDEHTIRKAVAAYYGLCSFLDHQVGKVLQTLEDEGLSGNTRIIYTSDHGDTLGDHGVWFKSTMYEGSVGVPMIISGPDIPEGKVVETPVTLVDCYPTIVDCVGASLNEQDADLPGTSLLQLAKEESDPSRIAFSEYHASSSITGTFMIRNGKYKYIHYVYFAPQLFNLEEDPNELNDLAMDLTYTEVLMECEQKLRRIMDPEETDRKVKQAQAEKVMQYGGREAVLKGGYAIPYSPVPPQFR
jgi:choline-sulfatase